MSILIAPWIHVNCQVRFIVKLTHSILPLFGLINIAVANRPVDMIKKQWSFLCVVHKHIYTRSKPQIELVAFGEGHLPDFIGCHMTLHFVCII